MSQCRMESSELESDQLRFKFPRNLAFFWFTLKFKYKWDGLGFQCKPVHLGIISTIRVFYLRISAFIGYP